MSTGAECHFEERKKGEWHYHLQRYPYGETQEYDSFGPFPHFKAAHDHLSRNHANPGGYGVSAKPGCKHDMLGEAHEQPAPGHRYDDPNAKFQTHRACDRCGGEVVSRPHKQLPKCTHPGCTFGRVGQVTSRYGATSEGFPCPNCHGSGHAPRKVAAMKKLADVIEKADGPRFKVGDYVKSKACNVGAGNLGGVHGRILATRKDPTLGTMHEVEWSHGASDSSGAVSAKAWRREMRLDAGTKDEFERQRGKGLAKRDDDADDTEGRKLVRDGPTTDKHHYAVPDGENPVRALCGTMIKRPHYGGRPTKTGGMRICPACGPMNIARIRERMATNPLHKLADVVAEAEWRGGVEAEIVAKAKGKSGWGLAGQSHGGDYHFFEQGKPDRANYDLQSRCGAAKSNTKMIRLFPTLDAAKDYHGDALGGCAKCRTISKAAEPAVAGKNDPATKLGRPPARTGGSKPGQVVHRSQTGYEVIASGREHPIPGGQHYEVHPIGRKQKVGEIYANPIGRAGETGIHLQPVAISHDGVNLGEHDGFDAAVQAIASHYETAEGAKRAGTAAKQASDAVTGRVRSALGGATGKTDGKPAAKPAAGKSKPASKAKPMKKLADLIGKGSSSGGHKCGSCVGKGKFRGRKCAICNGTGYHMPSQGYSAQDCYCGKPSEGRDVPVSKAQSDIEKAAHTHRYDEDDCRNLSGKCSIYAHKHCSDCGTAVMAEGGGSGGRVGGYDAASCKGCGALLCHACGKKRNPMKKLGDLMGGTDA